MAERSWRPNRRSVRVAGREAELCGIARARFGERTCGSPAARRSHSPRLVAITSCVSFLAALMLTTFVATRGPNGVLPPNPQHELPVAAVADHSIADLFARSR